MQEKPKAWLLISQKRLKLCYFIDIDISQRHSKVISTTEVWLKSVPPTHFKGQYKNYVTLISVIFDPPSPLCNET